MATSEARLLSLALLAACTPRMPPEAPRPADLALGRAVYRSSCAPCHGVEGHGDGPVAPYLAIAPRALADAQYKFRSTPTGALPTDADLFAVVTGGLRGTPMRAFRDSLSPHQRRSVVAYVKTLSPRFGQAEPPPQVVRVPRAPPPDPRRGAIVYREMKCAECHGDSGRGDGPANPTLRDYRGAPNPSHDFGRGFLKRGRTRRSLYLTLRTGLDGTAMPSYGDTLTERDLWALVDYSLSLVPRGGFWAWLTEPRDLQE